MTACSPRPRSSPTPGGSDPSLEELNRWLLDSLDMVSSLDGTLHTDLELGKKPETVFAAARPVLRSLVDFVALGFVLVSDEGPDFDLTQCDPPEARPLLQLELNAAIADGTFAWSLHQNRLVMLPGRSGRLMLHALATRFRVAGAFVGLLEENSSSPLTAAQKLLSIILHQWRVRWSVASVVKGPWIRTPAVHCQSACRLFPCSYSSQSIL